MACPHKGKLHLISLDFPNAIVFRCDDCGEDIVGHELTMMGYSETHPVNSTITVSTHTELRYVQKEECEKREPENDAETDDS